MKSNPQKFDKKTSSIFLGDNKFLFIIDVINGITTPSSRAWVTTIVTPSGNIIDGCGLY